MWCAHVSELRVKSSQVKSLALQPALFGGTDTYMLWAGAIGLAPLRQESLLPEAPTTRLSTSKAKPMPPMSLTRINEYYKIGHPSNNLSGHRPAGLVVHMKDATESYGTGHLYQPGDNQFQKFWATSIVNRECCLAPPCKLPRLHCSCATRCFSQGTCRGYTRTSAESLSILAPSRCCAQGPTTFRAGTSDANSAISTHQTSWRPC